MSERRKRRLFWIITLATAVLVPAGMEAVLQFFDYGGDLRLVHTRVINGVEYYTLNRDVGRRYFTQQNIGIPEAHDEPFTREKPPGTKRIFMLGESTMAGFPFDYNATPPDLLRDRLSAMYPGTRFEVINAGLSAINSYAVCEFADELAGYQPDLYIVYLGHNEFYGALGVGSSRILSRSGALVRTYLWLLRVRTFRLLRDGLLAVRRWIHPEAAPGDVTLIGAMARERLVPFGSEDYALGREVYRDNLQRIIASAKEHAIPLVLSTVACNLRDQKPLAPQFSAELPPARRSAWETVFARGRTAFAAGAFAAALACYDSCIAIDPMRADGQYARARTLDTLGRREEAAGAYRRARDYDALRLRASDEFNDIVRQTCAGAGVPCSDAERAFASASEAGVPGSNLMLEHLHPTFDGYFLLAKVFAGTVAEGNLLRLEESRRVPQDAALREVSGVTPFELEVARYRISRLLDNWPFQETPLPVSSYTPADTVGELAVQYAKKRLPWSQAHYALGGWYAARGAYADAKAEYFAVSKVAPYNYYPFMEMGDMERLLEQPASAESLYRLALTKQESPFVRVRLGMLLFDRGRGTEAVEAFEQTFTAEERSQEKMDAKARSMARFFLGAAYGRTGDLARARSNLRLAVELDPQNVQARSMLENIR
jgi:tetratricopeptide (TPR) repeat protein